MVQGFNEALTAKLDRGEEEMDLQIVSKYKAKVFTTATTGYL